MRLQALENLRPLRVKLFKPKFVGPPSFDGFDVFFQSFLNFLPSLSSLLGTKPFLVKFEQFGDALQAGGCPILQLDISFRPEKVASYMGPAKSQTDFATQTFVGCITIYRQNSLGLITEKRLWGSLPNGSDPR